jgi:starch phosphorylase
MSNVHAFHVLPALPKALDGLHPLALNLRWAWEHDTVELFRRLDRTLWEKVGHNPVQLLGNISQDRLREVVEDDAFLSQLERAQRSNYAYMKSASTWYKRVHAHTLPSTTQVAYFSMEFGITECLPIYSGGLGVLAGDHLKSSSDLGIPLVGVGLLYQMGYFRQYLSADGWQQERYPENDFYNMPIQPAKTADGADVVISVDMPGRTVYARVWVAQVGRVPLYLLDTNIGQNGLDDQNITDTLYGGDMEMRLKQEIVLGIGGLRALAALGIRPTICHMNEGHSAFLALERVRLIMQEHQVDFAVAQELAASGNVFTTHTPVPAGFDVFPADMLGRYFGDFIRQIGISFEDFIGLGRVHPGDNAEQFNMAMLALHNAHAVNGVSRLHGRVTRRMVQSVYSGFPEDEVPVSYVTNGIHARSFTSPEMASLLDRYVGGRWSQDPTPTDVWERVNDIPDEELWRVRETRRESLISYARQRLWTQFEHRGMSDYEIRETRNMLNPNVLTLGFARRFATYKRATLLFSDPERLIKILTDPHRPVQLLFAGKAHPRDDGGKELIRQILQFARRPEVRSKIVFLEDYDLDLARHLVQGVDIWLNTPRRPMEASGTSGMKVLANGGINVSVPDGWWAEGYGPQVGWSIGHGEEYDDPDYQDRQEAAALYDILEKEVVPLFYDRNTDGVPRAWVARIKNSMRLLCPRFNTNRMVAEYAERFYFPATKRFEALQADELARARAVVDWKRRLGSAWGGVRVRKVESQTADGSAAVRVGSDLAITAWIELGSLTPEDVQVQAFHGPLDANHEVVRGQGMPLQWKRAEDGVHLYEGEIPTTASGLQGFTVRILPGHEDVALPQELPLVTWE